MESMVRILILININNIDIRKFLYTSVRMRKQALLRHSILRLRRFWHSIFNDRKSQHHQIMLASTDELHTSILNHQMYQVALDIQM